MTNDNTVAAWTPILDTTGLHESGDTMQLPDNCALSNYPFRKRASQFMAQGRHYTVLVVEFDGRYAFVDAEFGLHTWLQPQNRSELEHKDVKAIHLIAVANFRHFHKVCSFPNPLERTAEKVATSTLMRLVVDANRISYASATERQESFLARRHLLGSLAVFNNANRFVMYMKLLLSVAPNDPIALQRLRQFLQKPNTYELVALSFYDSYSVQLVLGDFFAAGNEFEHACTHYQRAIELTEVPNLVVKNLEARKSHDIAQLHVKAARDIVRLTTLFQKLHLASQSTENKGAASERQ